MTTKPDLKTRIKDAIEACTAGDFGEQALNLLATLGYQGPRLSYFTQKSFAEFDAFFVQGNERFNPKKAHAAHWASVDVLLQLTADQLRQQDSLFTKDKVDPNAYESYLFFAIELKPKGKGQAWTRTDLSQITREVNKLFLMPAMILFKHGDALSFSVIDRRLHKRESSRDVLEKVTLIKDIRTSGTNRAHIEILFDLSVDELRRVHKFATFPALHAAWRKTLDTKELNRKFFRELSNWYFHAVAVAEFPDPSAGSGQQGMEDREKRNATNPNRLITRLMFVWFLREKELVPDALFDPKELKKILKPDAKEPSLYYKAILQNLFFATLNTEMGKRRFLATPDKSQSRHHFIHNVFRYEHCFADPQRALKELFDPIPFLNGGLFECLDKETETKGGLQRIRIDGFSNNPKNPLHLPESLSFNPEGEEHDFSEVYGTTRARKEKVRGLIDILGSYKFTITENTPIEEEVALDPELLGKVFENLLANFNPETKTTARKQTGSFYTPREIVNYMVDESLIAYLKGALTPALSEGEGGMPLTPALSEGEGEMPLTPGSSPGERGAMPGYMTGDPATVAKLMAHANSMRKNPTKAEDKLWQAIRGHATGGRIRRQHIIGNFIVDFVSLPKRLVIEIDGDIHDLQKEQDEARTTLLNEYGFKVIRFRNEEVLADVFVVQRAVVAELDARPDVTEAHAPPSPPERGPGGEGALNERALTPTLSEGEGERRLRHLLSYTEEPHQFSKTETEALIAAIDHCKILDPACGSGAFPMGVLHKLVHVLHKLDPNNKKWKERQIEKAGQLDDADIRERTIADIEDAFSNNALDYGRKLYLIENCIHGVDIQPIAMQIAKLRFFISLVVDQHVRRVPPLLGRGAGGEGNLGIRPLPNLETKFVAANTLMKLEKEEQNLFTHPGIEQKKAELKRVRHAYFEARSPQRKAKCRADDKRLREELAALLMQENELQPATAKMLAAWDPYDQNASAPFFDPEWMFGLKGGFDVVIGNPPYVDIKGLDKAVAKELFGRFSTARNRINLYSFFIESSHSLLSDRGTLSFIIPNSLLVNESYTLVRKLLMPDVTSLIKLPDGIFEAVVETILLFATKGAEGDVVHAKHYEYNAVIDFACIEFQTFSRKKWSTDDEWRFNIFSTNKELALCEKIAADAAPLDSFADFSLGITPYDKYKGHSQKLIKAREYHASSKLSDEYVPLIDGSNIQRYIVDDTVREWLRYGPWLGASREERFFTKPRIIVRQIASGSPLRIYAGYTTKHLYHTQLGFAILANPKVSPIFILGLLNSSLINFYHTEVFLDQEKNTFQKVLIANCKKLPIRIPSPKIQSHLEKLVEQRMALPPGAAALAIEKQIDQVVYGLYGLTAAEVALVEASVGASRGKGGKGGGKKKGADGGGEG